MLGFCLAWALCLLLLWVRTCNCPVVVESTMHEVIHHLWPLQSYKTFPEPQGWGILQIWYRVIHSGLSLWFFYTGLCWTSALTVISSVGADESCTDLGSQVMLNLNKANLFEERRKALLSSVTWKHSWVCHCSPFLWTLPSWLPVGKLQPSPMGTQHIQDLALSTTCSVDFQACLTSSQRQKPVPYDTVSIFNFFGWNLTLRYASGRKIFL